MVKTKARTVETFKFNVYVSQHDIDGGKCRDPHRCMEKTAIFRALITLLGEGEVERVRIDGAQIKFNYGGHRWYATTPKTAKVNLIRFDKNQSVQPHKYSVTAIKGTKIQHVTAERQHEINLARQERIAAGTPDQRRDHSLRKRIIGLGAV